MTQNHNESVFPPYLRSKKSFILVFGIAPMFIVIPVSVWEFSEQGLPIWVQILAVPVILGMGVAIALIFWAFTGPALLAGKPFDNETHPNASKSESARD